MVIATGADAATSDYAYSIPPSELDPEDYSVHRPGVALSGEALSCKTGLSSYGTSFVTALNCIVLQASTLVCNVSHDKPADCPSAYMQ